jgi:hypothetical protein
MQLIPKAVNSRALFIHRFISVILWVIFAVVVARQTATVIHASGVPIAGNDFAAFYCGGEAVLTRTDPYLVEPLRTCEHGIPHGSTLPAQYVTPTPQPGYTLGVFSLLALMPYRTAAYLAYFLLIAVCIAIAIVVAKAAGVPSGAVALALLVSGVFASGTYGQIPPICALGVALAGLALVRHQYTLATIAAAIAMIEPHTGVATAIALFCFAPRTRIPLAVSGLVLAAISIAAIGFHANVEYFIRVLGEHAHAELFSNDQYSLSHLLARYTSENFAVTAGTLSFILMLAIGLLLARKAARMLDSDACIAYVPAAATLLGGTFLHEPQLIVALPAAFLFAMRGQGIVAFAGRFLLIVIAAAPFTAFAEHTRNALLLATLIAILSSLATVHLGVARENFTKLAVASVLLTLFAIGLPFIGMSLTQLPASAFAATPAAVISAAAIRTATTVGPSNAQLTAAEVIGPDAQASVNWGAYSRWDPQYSTAVPGTDRAKVSFWLALVLFLGVIVLTGTGPARGETALAQAQAADRHWLAGAEIRTP